MKVVRGFKSSSLRKRASKPARGRKRIKGKPMLFKFKKGLGIYLRRTAKKSNRDMVEILEELIQYRMRFKSWPPTSENPSTGVVIPPSEMASIRANLGAAQ